MVTLKKSYKKDEQFNKMLETVGNKFPSDQEYNTIRDFRLLVLSVMSVPVIDRCESKKTRREMT